jgi:hypothetical protein
VVPGTPTGKAGSPHWWCQVSRLAEPELPTRGARTPDSRGRISRPATAGPPTREGRNSPGSRGVGGAQIASCPHPSPGSPPRRRPPPRRATRSRTVTASAGPPAPTRLIAIGPEPPSQRLFPVGGVTSAEIHIRSAGSSTAPTRSPSGRDRNRPRVAPALTARRPVVGVRRTVGPAPAPDRHGNGHAPLQSVCRAGFLWVPPVATGLPRRRRPVAQRGRTATLHPHLGTTLWIVAPEPVDGRPENSGQLAARTGTGAGQPPENAGHPRPAASVPSRSRGSVPRTPHRPTCADGGYPHCAQDLFLFLEFSLSRTRRERGGWMEHTDGAGAGLPRPLVGREPGDVTPGRARLYGESADPGPPGRRRNPGEPWHGRAVGDPPGTHLVRAPHSSSRVPA